MGFYDNIIIPGDVKKVTLDKNPTIHSSHKMNQLPTTLPN